ncbi:MAG: hypothetical protein AB7K24_13250 [Gemmataceae bacterium]
MSKADSPHFGSSIVRVTLLTTDTATNEVRPLVYYSKTSKKKKKGSKGLRPLERLVRFDAEARKAVVDDYLDRHSQSNERKRNGWLRDLGKNVFKAMKAGHKKLKQLDEDDDDE